MTWVFIKMTTHLILGCDCNALRCFFLVKAKSVSMYWLIKNITIMYQYHSTSELTQILHFDWLRY